jgi:4'-phosphopantetheinyl transferase
VLSPAERQVMEQLSETARDIAILRYVTRKEAVLKAVGVGLGMPLTQLTVSGPSEPPRVVAWNFSTPTYLVDLQPSHGFVAAAALLSATPHKIVEHDADSLLWDSRPTLSR